MTLLLLLRVALLLMQPASEKQEEEAADQEEEEEQQFGRALEEWHVQVAGAAAEVTKRITIRALKRYDVFEFAWV